MQLFFVFRKLNSINGNMKSNMMAPHKHDGNMKTASMAMTKASIKISATEITI
jgi:hypothetical protein